MHGWVGGCAGWACWGCKGAGDGQPAAVAASPRLEPAPPGRRRLRDAPPGDNTPPPAPAAHLGVPPAKGQQLAAQAGEPKQDWQVVEAAPAGGGTGRGPGVGGMAAQHRVCRRRLRAGWAHCPLALPPPLCLHPQARPHQKFIQHIICSALPCWYRLCSSSCGQAVPPTGTWAGTHTREAQASDGGWRPRRQHGGGQQAQRSAHRCSADGWALMQRCKAVMR